MTFSIIIPIYNASNVLSRTINSILSQDFRDFELILIDDGSTDNSLKVCQEYMTIDSRIRVFKKPNGGVSSTRNIGLEVANGEWICFIDSDDEMLPGALQAYADAMKDDVDVIRAAFEREKGGGVIEVMTKPKVTSDKSEAILICNKSRYEAYLWNTCFRQSAIGNLSFNTRLSFCEDHLFTYSVMAKARKIAFISDKVYHYYAPNTTVVTNSGNLSSRYLEPSMIMEGAVWERDVKRTCVEEPNAEVLQVIREEFEWKVRLAIRYALLDNRYKVAWQISSQHLENGLKTYMSLILHMKVVPLVRRLIK